MDEPLRLAFLDGRLHKPGIEVRLPPERAYLCFKWPHSSPVHERGRRRYTDLRGDGARPAGEGRTEAREHRQVYVQLDDVGGLCSPHMTPSTSSHVSVEPARSLTITAQRSAAMTVRLLRAAKFYLGEPGDDGPVIRMKGGGEFAGFLLIPTHQDAIGQLVVRRDGADPAYFTAGDPVVTVPAGTYRLHVAASAPVTITVPVTGLPRTRWHPAAPLTTSHATATWDMPLGPTLTGTAQVALRSRSVGGSFSSTT